ncbi:hypothetical protein [Lysinibacter sp. HNR]|uniref:hypothetical protein n=1 Tax=Lysinibacter sp. HNR TaxID=3031408 RepID=UPI002434B8E1|nr:hypothetical protein [Lysinibacter sp. HNR]WGD36340.1 hypothetical protein FrondiHNR_07560 [Lysinibacter sp. HNR]
MLDKVREVREEDRARVIELRGECGLVRPWNNPHLDFDRKRAIQPELFLAGERDGSVEATLMA